MDTLQLLRVNLNLAHDSFTKTVADVTKEMADWVPPGVAHPIGERYAHLAVSEDWLVNGMSRGSAPWYLSTWAGKTGFATFNLAMTGEEARAFRVELAPLHDYAKAIFAASEEYLNSLDEREIERGYDMSIVGYGSVPAPVWWSTFITGHVRDIMGEISALKGCLGKKGYPF